MEEDDVVWKMVGCLVFVLLLCVPADANGLSWSRIARCQIDRQSGTD
jgi:hypothetical protein